MKLTINHKYKLLQGLFWMLFCVASGFISLYLQGRGMETGGIGIVTAAFGLLAAGLQPMLGRVCDQRKTMTWKKMMQMLLVPFLLCCILMPIVPGKYTGAVLMGMLLLLGNVMMPFVNSAHFYYTQKGEQINFGVARGTGSALYAVLALLIGFLAAKFGIEVVPVCGIVIAVLLILLLLRMPCEEDEKHADNIVKSERRKGFLRHYPAFAVMLIACIFMLTTHNIINTYMLQIIQSLGGDSSELGVTLAIQAILEVPVLFGFSFLLKRFRPTTLMVISAAGYALKTVMIALSNSIFMIYASQLTQMCSFAIFASASVYYTASQIRSEDQTTGQAYMTSMIATGTVLGSLIGGWVLQCLGMRAMLNINMAIGFIGVGFAVVSSKIDIK